jgi:hypothetical protein
MTRGIERKEIKKYEGNKKYYVFLVVFPERWDWNGWRKTE